MHKMAGAAASRGAPLQEVHAMAQRTADSLATLGVAMTVCTLPGKQPSDRCVMANMKWEVKRWIATVIKN